MNRLFAISTLLLSFSALSQTAVVADFKARHYCPVAAKTVSIAEIPDYLEKNNIVLKNAVEAVYQAQFLNEYLKFPDDLRLKMIEAGAVIHLIQGEGVTDDPSWNSGGNTFDGRAWAAVPGSGGIPSLGERAPTRVVVNHLYDRHGSNNLFLHEHGHSLDSIIEGKQLSSATEWKTIAAAEPTKKFLKIICGDYCVNNNNEAFAELFAYYYACPATKADIDTYLPDVAKYIISLPDLL